MEARLGTLHPQLSRQCDGGGGGLPQRPSWPAGSSAARSRRPIITVMVPIIRAPIIQAPIILPPITPAPALMRRLPPIPARAKATPVTALNGSDPMILRAGPIWAMMASVTLAHEPALRATRLRRCLHDA